MYEVCSHWWRIRIHSSLLVIVSIWLWKTDPRPVVLADLSQSGDRKQHAVDLQRCFYYRFCLHFHLRCASMYVKSFLQQYEVKLNELDSSFSNEPPHPLLSFFVPVCTKKYNKSKQILRRFQALSRYITSSFINLFSSCQWNSHSNFRQGLLPSRSCPSSPQL